MAPSKAHKYFNKFSGWSRHEGMVNVERPEAMDEFFINPGLIPENSRSLGSDLLGAALGHVASQRQVPHGSEAF